MGDILVAVNPFQQLPIYDEFTASKYVNSPHGMQPPHLFAVADRAFQAMVREQRPQVGVGELASGVMASGGIPRSLMLLDPVPCLSALSILLLCGLTLLALPYTGGNYQRREWCRQDRVHQAVYPAPHPS